MLSCQLCCCCAQSPPTTPSAVANNPQFFESINPLDGFEDSNALEEYLYNQSKKIEPGKEDVKWDFQKPKRSTQTLKSPGIKVPKWQQSALANGAPSSPNVYHRSAPVNLSLEKTLVAEGRPSSSQVSSPVDESPFGIVDIHPGHQPVYIRDAKPGSVVGQRPSLPLRRSVPPPSPGSEAPREMAPPPLHPRRVSPPKTASPSSAPEFPFLLEPSSSPQFRRPAPPKETPRLRWLPEYHQYPLGRAPTEDPSLVDFQRLSP
uniref:SH2 domain-containing protein n=1 Tax=Steinernema glaseri TaxID=37863 RepID=A0A1I8AH53_9BILA